MSETKLLNIAKAMQETEKLKSEPNKGCFYFSSATRIGRYG